MSADFPIHTGRRKRPRSAEHVAKLRDRRAGTRAEQEAALALYSPPAVTLHCEKCGRLCYAGKCRECDA